MLSAVIFFTVQTVSEGGLYAKKNEKEKERKRGSVNTSTLMYSGILFVH